MIELKINKFQTISKPQDNNFSVEASSFSKPLPTNERTIYPNFKNLIAYTIPFTSAMGRKKLFVEEVIKQADGNEYQGVGLYVKKEDGSVSDYIDWENKVGWEHLKNEPVNWRTVTEKDLQVFWHALALAETNDSTWPRRFTPRNVLQPLAVYRNIVAPKAKRSFIENLKELSALQKSKDKFKSLLDTPVIDSNNRLNFPFTVFDTETTGINLPTEPSELDAMLSPEIYKNDSENIKPSKIIQIGAIKFDNGRIIPVSGLSQLINPEEPIPQQSTDVHGITDDKVKDKPKIESLLRAFEHDYLGKSNIIVGYNSKFDISLLNHSIRSFNKLEGSNSLDERKQCLALDPLLLISRIHPYLGAKKKLGEQYKFLFGQDLEGAHDAFTDVRATADILKYCLNFLDKKSKEKGKILTLRDVFYFQNGYCTPNIGIVLNQRGLNAEKSFAESYGKDAEVIGVDKFHDGYKLTSEIAAQMIEEIGIENVEILKHGGLIDLKIDDVSGLKQLPKETLNDLKHKYAEKTVNHQYLMEENFRTVLLNIGIKEFGDKSKEQVIDCIVEKSKNFINKRHIDIWMKNADLADVNKGNDLPDIEIARKVMLEKYEDDERMGTIKPRELNEILKSKKIETKPGD